MCAPSLATIVSNFTYLQMDIQYMAEKVPDLVDGLKPQALELW